MRFGASVERLVDNKDLYFNNEQVPSKRHVGAFVRQLITLRFSHPIKIFREYREHRSIIAKTTAE
jgi:hypothetical protein